VIVALSRVADKLPARIISSPARACEITRSKLATYRLFDGIVRVPHLFASAHEVHDYPVFVKPDRGQGSFGATKVDHEEALAATLHALVDPVICEYLPGEEFTIDCFSDRDKGVLFAGARSRRRMRNGISVNTLTQTMPQATEIAQRIWRELGLRGAWFFQLKRATDGELVLLEIAPRIAGAMAAHRVMGINFPLLSIFEEERLPLSVHPLGGVVELDRALGNRYRHSIKFDTIYIDLDDTLLTNGRVNIAAVKLLYQCINSGRKIVLLTRHTGNLDDTLAKHRLAGLFDEVICLRQGEKKSSRIGGGTSIFVDDSFGERMDVAELCGIPTFDCSMIELLTEQAEFLNGDR